MRVSSGGDDHGFADGGRCGEDEDDNNGNEFTLAEGHKPHCGRTFVSLCAETIGELDSGP